MWAGAKWLLCKSWFWLIFILLWKYPLLRMLKQCCLKFSLSKGWYFSLCVVTDQLCYFSHILNLIKESKLIVWKWNVVETSHTGQIKWNFIILSLIVFKPVYYFPYYILNITLICTVIYTLLLRAKPIRVELSDQR